jgi:hypothetical protein
MAEVPKEYTLRSAHRRSGTKSEWTGRNANQKRFGTGRTERPFYDAPRADALHVDFRNVPLSCIGGHLRISPTELPRQELGMKLDGRTEKAVVEPAGVSETCHAGMPRTVKSIALRNRLPEAEPSVSDHSM